MKKKSLIFYLPFFLIACRDKIDSRITFVNNSDQRLVILTSFYDYPDTVNFKLYCNIREVNRIIEPNSRKNLYSGNGNNWRETLNNASPSTWMFFIYNMDSVTKLINYTTTNCDTLVKRKGLILKRFDISETYLNQNSWTITYP